jgi:hypothetical protein
MRAGIPYLIVIASFAVLTVFALSSSPAEGVRQYVDEDFEDPVGGVPDPSIWEVDVNYPANTVTVEQGQLITHVEEGGHAVCRMANEFSNRNLTVNFEFMRTQISGYNFEVRVDSWGEHGGGLVVSFFNRDGYWKYRCFKAGNHYESNDNWLERDLRTGIWFRATMEIRYDLAFFTVWERDTGVEVWKVSRLVMDPMEDRSTVEFGAYWGGPNYWPHTSWDNISIYDYRTLETAPVWHRVPILSAVEDVVVSYDFERYITDDQAVWEWTLTSDSPYVTAIDNLTVSFLFPNNVIQPGVILVVDDGLLNTSLGVAFLVTAINDPPEFIPPPAFSVPEGIPTTIDLAPFIYDIDDHDDNLSLASDSPYAVTGPGLKVTVTFPEGLLSHELTVNITDRNATVPMNVSFLIERVNNPPTVSDIPEQLISEGVPGVVDLSPYVSDPDDPPSRLNVSVSSEWCIVEGMDLTFTYDTGGWEEEVTVWIQDGSGGVSTTFTVSIIEVNDPPTVDGLPKVQATEDRVAEVDLTAFLDDEESPVGDLRVSSDHPNVVGTDGRILELLYSHNNGMFQVWFNVSDGTNMTPGILEVSVEWVNDDPRFISVGDKEISYIDDRAMPFHVIAPRDRTARYKLVAEDEDNSELTFSVEANWYRIEVEGDELLVHYYGPSYTGQMIATLTVHDPRGGSGSVNMLIGLGPWVEPNVDIIITIVNEDGLLEVYEPLRFKVDISDPDGYWEDDLSIFVSSDITGELFQSTWSEGKVYQVDFLHKGNHNITVRVSDGYSSIWEYFTVVVIAQSDDGPQSSGGSSTAWMCGISILVLLIIGGVIAFLYRAEVMDATKIVRGRRTRREHERQARLIAEREAKGVLQVPEPSPPGPSAPSTVPSPIEVELPTPEELTEHLREKVLMALEAMPNSLPSDLSLYDMSTIADRIVSGRRRTSPDGRLIVFVQGNWYYGNPDDKDFMTPFEEP